MSDYIIKSVRITETENKKLKILGGCCKANISSVCGASIRLLDDTNKSSIEPKKSSANDFDLYFDNRECEILKWLTEDGITQSNIEISNKYSNMLIPKGSYVSFLKPYLFIFRISDKVIIKTKIYRTTTVEIWDTKNNKQIEKPELIQSQKNIIKILYD